MISMFFLDCFPFRSYRLSGRGAVSSARWTIFREISYMPGGHFLEKSVRQGMLGVICLTHILATGGVRWGRGWCPLASYMGGAVAGARGTSRVLVLSAPPSRSAGIRPVLRMRPPQTFPRVSGPL